MIADAGWPGTVVRVTSAGREFRRRPDGSVLLTVEAGEDWDGVVAASLADGLRRAGVPVRDPGPHRCHPGAERRRLRRGDRRPAGRRRPLRPGRGPWSARTCRRPSSGSATGPARSRAAPTPSCCGSGSRCRAAADSAPIRYPELARALGVETGARVPARRAREAVLQLRRGKGMVLDADDRDTWSAGSFFTNPVLPEADGAGRGTALAGRPGSGEDPGGLADRARRFRPRSPRPRRAGRAVATSTCWPSPTGAPAPPTTCSRWPARCGTGCAPVRDRAHAGTGAGRMPAVSGIGSLAR